MVFVFIIRFVVAAAITFIVINITSPIIYTMWYNELRPFNEGFPRLLAAGDTFFGNFLILSWVVPAMIIMWGIIVAQRKRVQQTLEEI